MGYFIMMNPLDEIKKALLNRSSSIEETYSHLLEDIEKGGKKAFVGEIRTFGGREYIKTAQGWKFHGKGKGQKAQAHVASTKGSGLSEKINSLKGSGQHPQKKTTNINSSEIFKKTSKEESFKDINKKLSELTKHSDITSEKVWKESKEESVPLDKLIAIQKTVGKEVLLDKDKNGRESTADSEPIRLAKIGGEYHIINGTHRLALNILEGKKTSDKAQVIDLDSQSSTKLSTAEDLLSHPKTKQILEDMGLDDSTQFLAQTKNYKPNTYFRIEGTGIGYTGAGEGMYLGRDKEALKKFYDIEGQGLKVREFTGKPNFADLMDYDKYEAFEKEAIEKYGEDRKEKFNHLKKLAQEKGYDGIRYYDAHATGEEFVIFESSKLKEVAAENTHQDKLFKKLNDGSFKKMSRNAQYTMISQSEKETNIKESKLTQKFTPDEIDALDIYASKAFRDINAHLRGTADVMTAPFDRSLKSVVEDIDNAISKNVLKEDIIVYRSLSGGESLKADKAFQSTSIDPYASYQFKRDGGKIYKLKIPKGTNYAYMGGGEKEMLLPRGLDLSKYVVE